MQTRTASHRRPRLTEDIMPFSEYRGNLAACFDRVNETHRPLIVTRNGRADAVLVSAADFDPLIDFPLSGPSVPECAFEEHFTDLVGLRQLIVKPYRVIYEVTEYACNILNLSSRKGHVTFA